GPAARLGFGQERRVVLLGGRMVVRAHDLLDRAVEIAIAPLADPSLIPHVSQLTRRVAACIARIGPVLALEVEVLGREEIDRQRLDAGRRARLLGLGDGGRGQQRRNDAEADRSAAGLRDHVEILENERSLLWPKASSRWKKGV